MTKDKHNVKDNQDIFNSLLEVIAHTPVSRHPGNLLFKLRLLSAAEALQDLVVNPVGLFQPHLPGKGHGLVKQGTGNLNFEPRLRGISYQPHNLIVRRAFFSCFSLLAEGRAFVPAPLFTCSLNSGSGAAP